MPCDIRSHSRWVLAKIYALNEIERWRSAWRANR